MAAARTHAFQAPKGTRDFPPAELAVRRHLESVWRETSIAHGFDEIDGPTFEHLDLYTVKSGPGIVSELFSFRRAGGDTEYALRPEFTPTVARMVAKAARTLSHPTKWFSIPSHFRAERPQRGRLREFYQWNADVIGDPTAHADAEVVAVTVGMLERLGLDPDQVQVKISDRGTVTSFLEEECGLPADRVPPALDLLDRRDRLPAEKFAAAALEIDFGTEALARFDAFAAAPPDLAALADRPPATTGLAGLARALREREVLDWCHVDLSIVRGLAYYTGTVFEVHETTGSERAIAGGGRYDDLVELFGGPPTPAVGIAMGDVVLRLVLEERGLLEPPETYLPHPDVFVIDTLDDDGATMRGLVARLRRSRLHVRHSYRATRNVGKLLGEASRVHARFAAILGAEYESGEVLVKELETGAQRAVPVQHLETTLRLPWGLPGELPGGQEGTNA